MRVSLLLKSGPREFLTGPMGADITGRDDDFRRMPRRVEARDHRGRDEDELETFLSLVGSILKDRGGLRSEKEGFQYRYGFCCCGGVFFIVARACEMVMRSVVMFVQCVVNKKNKGWGTINEASAGTRTYFTLYKHQGP
jgi:hypothetical protein